jgi:NAD(P)H dehydrogenase (quinone)
VAAAILTTEGHAGCVYEITEPDRYDAAALAALYTRVSGRSVQAIALDDGAFIRAVLGANSVDDPPGSAQSWWRRWDGRSARGNFAACTNDVARLSGRPARTLREVIEAGLHAARP